MSKRPPSPKGPSVRARVAVPVIAAALLLLAIALVVAGGSEKAQPLDAAQAREKARGFTDSVTVIQLGPDQVSTTTDRPKELPPLILASEECKPVLDEARDFFDKNPYGATLGPELTPQLNSLVTALNVSTECDDDTKSKFMAQEFTPWLSWADPERLKELQEQPPAPTETPTETPTDAPTDAPTERAPSGKKTISTEKPTP